MVVDEQLDVHAVHAVPFLEQQRLASHERHVAVELDAEAAAALERRRGRVDVLAPVCVEALDAQAARGQEACVGDSSTKKLTFRLKGIVEGDL